MNIKDRLEAIRWSVAWWFEDVKDWIWNRF
jgi:hypothetical protein